MIKTTQRRERDGKKENTTKTKQKTESIQSFRDGNGGVEDGDDGGDDGGVDHHDVVL